MLSVSNAVAFEKKDNGLSKVNQPVLNYNPALSRAVPVRFAGDQLILSHKTQGDNVSFEGLSKGGKLGVAGSVLLLVLGAVGINTAKAHTVVNQYGQAIKHKHEIPGGTKFYFDSNGRVVVSASTGNTRIDPGMQELERVYDQYNQPLGWREITRVYDENNNQKRIEQGSLLTSIAEANPEFENLPSWADDIIRQTPNGGTIIIPRPDYDPVPPYVKNSTRVEVYADSDGNVKVRVASGNVPRGHCEYEKIHGPGNKVGWRKVTRVYRNDELVRIERSSTVVYRNSPFDTGYGDVPPWLINHLNSMPAGNCVIIPDVFPAPPLILRGPDFVPQGNQESRLEFYFDNQGNWSARAHQHNTRLNSNMMEYERVYESGVAVGWREINRVYSHGQVTRITRGSIIRGPLPHHPRMDMLPIWARQKMMNCPHGHTVILPRPNFMPHPSPHWGQPPHRGHRNW